MRARENPFRVERLHALRYRPPGSSWDELLDRLAALRYRGAVLGPHGSGKTAALDELAQRLPARGLHPHPRWTSAEEPPLRWSELLPLVAELGPRDVLLFDGADLLPRSTWWRLRRATRSAGGLVIATHRARMLPTWLRTRPSPQLLAALVAELAPGHAADLDPLYRAHAGDLRASLRALYDAYAAGP